MSERVKPISPADIQRAKGDSIPDGVIEAFNELIIKGWDGRQSIVVQSEVETLIRKKTGYTGAQIHENNWLEVEDIYRKAGWKVEYESPAYNEDFPATFTFTKKSVNPRSR